jgi:hypothetical protein
MNKQLTELLELKYKPKSSFFGDLKNRFLPQSSNTKYLESDIDETNEDIISTIPFSTKSVTVVKKSPITIVNNNNQSMSSNIDDQKQLTVSNVNMLNNQMKVIESNSPLRNDSAFVDVKRPVTAPEPSTKFSSPSFSHNYNYNDEVGNKSHILSAKYDEQYKKQIIEEYKQSLQQQQQARPFTAPISSMSSMSGDDNGMNVSLGGVPVKMVTSNMFSPQQQQVI